MEIVDKTGANQTVNQTVYKSMREKLEKFEQVLSNISEEIKENYSTLTQQPVPSQIQEKFEEISPVRKQDIIKQNPVDL